MNKIGSKPVSLEPTFLSRACPEAHYKVTDTGVHSVCALPDSEHNTLPCVFTMAVSCSSTHSLQLPCTDLINHSYSRRHSDCLVFDTPLLCFSNGLDCSSVQSDQKGVNEWACSIKTLPPVAICFCFYHFCSFNRYKTEPHCLDILLLDYCKMLTFVSS